jgi:6-phosphogluconolactonase
MYRAWSRDFDICSLENVNFYFGDERCVPFDSLESNYNMAMSTLFERGVPKACTVHRIEAESNDLRGASDRYEALLPKSVDILLLSVGEDGHIASLFPHSTALYENRRYVLPVLGPREPCQRLTVTPPVILKAHSTFVLAAGAAKAWVLSEALRMPKNIDALPARLVIGGVWLLDRSIDNLIKNYQCK